MPQSGIRAALLFTLLTLSACGERTDDRRATVLGEVDAAMRERYFDPAYGGEDWGALLEGHRAGLLEAASKGQFYRRLNAMLFELGVSHLAVLPDGHPEWIGAPSPLSDGDVGQIIVGVRTPGIVLVADVVPLSTGDTLVIPVAQTETADGTVLEGRGVIPDIEVAHDVPSLLNGRGAQLDAALDAVTEAR